MPCSFPSALFSSSWMRLLCWSWEKKVGSYYIIEKGLDPTDVVIVEGLTTLRAGQDIDVTMVTPEEMGFSTTESTEITDKS